MLYFAHEVELWIHSVVALKNNTCPLLAQGNISGAEQFCTLWLEPMPSLLDHAWIFFIIENSWVLNAWLSCGWTLASRRHCTIKEVATASLFFVANRGGMKPNRIILELYWTRLLSQFEHLILCRVLSTAKTITPNLLWPPNFNRNATTFQPAVPPLFNANQQKDVSFIVWYHSYACLSRHCIISPKFRDIYPSAHAYREMFNSKFGDDVSYLYLHPGSIVEIHVEISSPRLKRVDVS